MKLGSIQKSILAYIDEGPPAGVWIGATTKSRHFGGLDLNQVEAALARLVERKIIEKNRPGSLVLYRRVEE